MQKDVLLTKPCHVQLVKMRLQVALLIIVTLKLLKKCWDQVVMLSKVQPPEKEPDTVDVILQRIDVWQDPS